MRLIRSSIEYKQQVLEYKNEFIENGDDLAGTSCLPSYYFIQINRSCS